MGLLTVNADHIGTNTGDWRGGAQLTCPANVPTGGHSDAEILAAAATPAPGIANQLVGGRVCGGTNPAAGGSLHIAGSLGGAILDLNDGNPAISFFSLPAGFHMTFPAINVQISLAANFTPTVAELYRGPFLSAHNLKPDIGPWPNAGTTASVSDNLYLTESTFPTVMRMLLNGWGLDFTPSNTGVTPFFIRAYQFRITALWDILFSSVTIGPAAVLQGGTITIHAASGLSSVTSVTGETETDSVVVSSFLTQSDTEITFLAPAIVGDTTFSARGTIFDGAVLLGTLTVLLVPNPSGIYRIIIDKRNDTLYLDSPSGPTTEDVAIPEPFGETGFIGG